MKPRDRRANAVVCWSFVAPTQCPKQSAASFRDLAEAFEGVTAAIEREDATACTRGIGIARPCRP
jgi:hypothetical protein